MAASAVTAKECLQSAEVCLALAHKTKELDTRAALLEIAYEFRTVAKLWSVLGRVLINAQIAASLHGAGRPLRRSGPAHFGSYRKWRYVPVSTAQAACHAPASVAVTAVTGYSSSTHHFLDAA
jgi:hypothetical protein